MPKAHAYCVCITVTCRQGNKSRKQCFFFQTPTLCPNIFLLCFPPSVTVSVTLLASVLNDVFYSLGLLSNNEMMVVFNILHLLMEDILIGFVQPITIIFKTRTYLPKLWDENCQIETNNNDFFAVNPFQVYPLTDLS